MTIKHQTGFIAAAVFGLTMPFLAVSAPLVTFQGEVAEQTCVPQINGETNAVVLMPTVPSSELATAGATTGQTPFTISVTDCTAVGVALNVTTAFLGHNVTQGGNLGNLATTNAAQNVAIQLTTDAAGTTAVTLNGVTPLSGLVVNVGDSAATYQFGARYIAEGGTATPGAVMAVAEYTLFYP